MFSLSNENKSVKIVLLSICLVTLILSAFIVLSYGNTFLLGSLEKMDNDDVKYLRSGKTFLETGRITYHNPKEPTAFIMPGITFVTAFLIKIFGFNGAIIAFRLLQCFLHMLIIALIFFLSRDIFGSKVGIISAILSFLYLPFYFTDGVILTEGIFTFLLLLLTYISLHALKQRRVLLYITGGIIWGLACLFRPTIALYPAVIFACWLVFKYKAKDMLKYSVLVIAVFSVIMLPWWVRNYNEFHRFIPLTESSGNPMLQGTYIGYTSRLDDPEYIKANALGDQPQVKLAKKRIVQNFSKEPVKYFLWYTFGKTGYFWGDAFYWRAIMGVPKMAVNVYHYILLLFGIIGIILSVKKKREAFLILFVILYFNLSHLPYFTAGRYAFPVMPMIIIFCAFSLNKFYNNIKNKKTNKKQVLTTNIG